jgi:hypothetical protein
LLARFCEASALAEKAAFELDQPNGTVTPDGKATAWVSIYMQAAKTVGALAPQLRLGPRARQRASKKAAGPAPPLYGDTSSPDWLR